MGATESIDAKNDQRKIEYDEYQIEVINDELDDLFKENESINHTQYDNAVERTNIQIKQQLENDKKKHRDEFSRILAEKQAKQKKGFQNFNKTVDEGFGVVNAPIDLSLDNFSGIEDSLFNLGQDFSDDLPYIIAGLVAVGAVFYFVTKDNN